jgi:hypothetical protein
LNFRKNAISQKIDLPIRPVNFGGAASAMKLLSPLAAGVREYEDDSAVVLPSSRFDFIYASALKAGYSEGEILPVSDFNETHFSPHYVVDALHMSVMPEVHTWAAIANIPSECIDNADCDHPTYKYVLAHLKNKVVVPDEVLLSKMTAFLLDLNIALPAGEQLDASKIKIEFASDDLDLKVADPMELYSHGEVNSVNNDSQTENYRHFYFTGTADHSYLSPEVRATQKTSAPFKDKTLTIKISAAGYKTRVVNAKVRATYSTFIDINLEK